MLTELTVSIVAAFVQHQRIEAGAIPDLIVAVHRTLGDIRAAGVLTSDPDVPPQAAVSVRKSLADPEWIVSMIDGKRYRMLKRHIGMHGLTPDAYRARYRLPASYPMVAPAYAAYRRALAKKIGLGRRTVSQPPVETTPAPAPAPMPASQAAAPKRRGRPKKATG